MIVNLEKKLDKNAYKTILECMKISEISGIKIYLVGGIVRDILLKKSIKDIDITIVGNAKTFVEILVRNIETDIIKYNDKLPTVKVTFKNGIEIDFASTREEKYENHGALPIITKIGCSLEEDIKRRDFTINSIAISLNKENLFQVIDYTKGIEDLKNKKIRILHNQSFLDDPSRIIRALKFSERLNFTFDNHTLNLLQEYINNPLKDIPLVRIKKEIKDLFLLNKNTCFDNFVKMKLYKIFTQYFNADLDGDKIKKAISEFKIKDEELWFLYLIPFFIEHVPSQKFNFDTRALKIISEIQDFYIKKIKFDDKYSIYKYFSKKDYLTAVYYAILFDTDTIKTFIKIKDIKLIVNGKDLQNIGIPAGILYKKIIETTLKEKINKGTLKNKKDEINFIKTNFIDKIYP